MNLGEVYVAQKEFDKAEEHYRTILRFQIQKSKEFGENANISLAYYGLAQIAIARKKSDEAIAQLQTAIVLDPNNITALKALPAQRYQRGEYDEGGKSLLSWLAKLPPAARQTAAEQFAKQLDDVGYKKAAEKAREAVKAAVKTRSKP